MDDLIKFKKEDWENISLKLLIRIFSTQRAQTKLMIEILKKSEEDADYLTNLMNQYLASEAKTVLSDLFGSHGDLDTTDLV